MGYDMTIRKSIPGEKDQYKAANDAFCTAVAARDALTEGKPAWFSPEDLSLPEEERAKIGMAHLAEMNRLRDAGVDFETARNLSGSIKPSKEWLLAQERVLEARNELDAAQTSYFRLNIFGMGRCCEIMDRLGMLKDGTQAREIPWPDWKEFHLAEKASEALHNAWDEQENDATLEDFRAFVLAHPEKVESWDSATNKSTPYAFTDLDLANFLRWREAHENKLSWHLPDTPGIGDNKFDSNDGWIVTEIECRSAVGIWQEVPDVVKEQVLAEDSWWDGWIRYLDRASRFGGFVVY